MQRIGRIAQDLLILRAEDLAFGLLRGGVIGNASLLCNIATVDGAPWGGCCAVLPTRATGILGLQWVLPPAFSAHARYAGKSELVLVVLEHDVALLIFVVVPVLVRFA